MTVAISGCRDALNAVPIPAGATPAAGSDAHVIVRQPATRQHVGVLAAPDALRRLARRRGRRHAQPLDQPRLLHARRLVRRSALVGGHGDRATAAGDRCTIAELQRGRIDHALAIALPHTRAKVWSSPATHGDGDSQDPTSLPEGARLRLNPALDLNKLNLPPLTRMMAEAAQRYGIVIRDRAGVVAFYGEDPSRLATNPYPAIFGNKYPDQLLASFPWRSLQVLRLDLRGPG